MGAAKRWKGYYVQHGEQHEVYFESVTVTNTAIQGMGIDEVGEFDLYGEVSGNFVNFTKQYRGKHAIAYHGTINDAHTTIEGHWGFFQGDKRDKFLIE